MYYVLLSEKHENYWFIFLKPCIVVWNFSVINFQRDLIMGFLCFKCGSWMCNGTQCYYCGNFTEEETKEHYGKYDEFKHLMNEEGV